MSFGGGPRTQHDAEHAFASKHLQSGSHSVSETGLITQNLFGLVSACLPRLGVVQRQKVERRFRPEGDVLRLVGWRARPGEHTDNVGH